MLSYCSKTARESEVSRTLVVLLVEQYIVLNLHHRTQHLQYNVLHRIQPLEYISTQISPHLHPHNPDGAFACSGPLWGLHTFKMVLHAILLLFSVKTHKSLNRCQAHPWAAELQSQAAKVFPCIC